MYRTHTENTHGQVPPGRLSSCRDRKRTAEPEEPRWYWTRFCSKVKQEHLDHFKVILNIKYGSYWNENVVWKHFKWIKTACFWCWCRFLKLSEPTWNLLFSVVKIIKTIFLQRVNKTNILFFWSEINGLRRRNLAARN